MEKALRQMRERLRQDRVGAVVEVRDARVPLSGRNWKFEELFRRRDEDYPNNSHHNTSNKKRSKASTKNNTVLFRDGWGQVVGAPVHAPFRMVVYNKTDLVDGPAYREGNGHDSKASPSHWRTILRQYHDQEAQNHQQSSFNSVDASAPLIFTNIKKHSTKGVDEILEVSIIFSRS
jgi:hypothetical protein